MPTKLASNSNYLTVPDAPCALQPLIHAAVMLCQQKLLWVLVD
jgi:hypothetical protein